MVLQLAAKAELCSLDCFTNAATSNHNLHPTNKPRPLVIKIPPAKHAFTYEEDSQQSFADHRKKTPL